MTGGLIQLLAWGSQNIKLNGNPSITFFKKVVKAYTNFSMESIEIALNRSTANVFENTIFRQKLERHGDLVQQIYFVFELPDILPNNRDFKWIENIGEAIIDNYYINIGGSMIDRQYGEYMHVQNALSMDSSKRTIYDKMIGNINELTNPAFRTGRYPTSNPVIAGRKIYVPLNFWFNKDSSSSLPLVCLQYVDVEIVLEIRPMIQLYQLFDFVLREYYAPLNPQDYLINFVSNENKTYMTSPSILDIKAYLEVNYYFLDQQEREYIVYNPHEYLIEQVFRIQRYNLSTLNVFEILLQNPVKEIIWVFKRSDLALRNSWFDFLDDYQPIMLSGKILFNGMDRLTEKDASYFNYIQPFQHHKTNIKDGVYVYSFSISPDDYMQPSGSCNMSRIQKIQFMFRCMAPLANFYNYDLNMYAINYNYFKIQNGLAGVVFSS